MKAVGLVSDAKSSEDRRATTVALTEKGKSLEKSLKSVCDDVKHTVEEIEHNGGRLWDAMNHWEKSLSDKSLLHRVIERKKRKESLHV